MSTFTLNAYSLVFSEHLQAKRLEYSNKILISASVLPDLNISDGPILFKLENGDKFVYTAMHEYVDSPGLCFLPHRILNCLNIADGDTITVKQAKDIPTGEFLKIKPFETAFIGLENPKVVLEKIISINYPILSQGEIIIIKYLDATYHIEVIECKPNPIIQTLNCDIILEFEKPYDYVEEFPIPTEAVIPEVEMPPDPRFPGVGRKLGSM